MSSRSVALAAHGEGDGSPINEAVLCLARRAEEISGIRCRAVFRLGTPAWSTLAANPVSVVVPLLTAEGHFRHGVLPGALGPAAPTEVRAPLGLHRWVLKAVAMRLCRQVSLLAAQGFAPAILVAAHGTQADPRSGAAAFERVRAFSRLLPATRVAAGFLDQSPAIETSVRLLVADEPRTALVVVPMFLGGSHVREDLPRRIAAATGASARPAVFLPPLIEEPVLLTALLEVLSTVGRADTVRA